MGIRHLISVFGALVLWMLTAQSAAALDCPASSVQTYAQNLYINATDDTCSESNSIGGHGKNGHYIGLSKYDVRVIVYYAGLSVSLSVSDTNLACDGGTPSNPASHIAGVSLSFPYATNCTLSYKDVSGNTVSHSFFVEGVRNLYDPDVGDFSFGAFSVNNGWFDHDRPTVTLSGLSNPAGASQTLTAQFNEAVTGFEATDLSLTNATVSDFTAVDADTYTFTLIPTLHNATISVELPENTVTDLNGNFNTASNTLAAMADTSLPSVSISGLPADFSGPTTFDASITFSEDVTGLTLAEINISGGTVTALTGSGANYTASVSVDGSSDLVMSIGADAAQDIAGNGNTASAEVSASNLTGSQTSALVTGFMQQRANALLGNQPRLAGFMQGNGGGTLNASVTRNESSLSYASRNDAPTWSRVTANRTAYSGAQNSYVFAAFGSHTRISDHTLLGGQFQLDLVDEVNGAASIKGSGWLIGPYFVTQLPEQPLLMEGSLLYGQTANEISPLGTYTDQFSTERWLATLGVSGQFDQGQTALFPFLDARYTSDAQEAYIDGLGNPIAAQSIALAQVTAGLNFETPIDPTTILNGGVSGIWSHTSGSASSATPAYEGGRARVELGLRRQTSPIGILHLSGLMDGLGASGFESVGVQFSWSAEF